MSRVPLSSLSNGTVLQAGNFLPAAGATAMIYVHDSSSTLWGGVNTPVAAPAYSTETGSSTLTQPLLADGNGQLPGWISDAFAIDIVATFKGVSSAPVEANPVQTSDSVPLQPSGGDDTSAVIAAIAAHRRLASNVTFLVSGALLTLASGELKGGGGRGATIIKAIPGTPVANFNTSARSLSLPALVQWNGGDAWAHGVRVTGIKFDTSGIAGLGATWFEAPGENSWWDDLRCDSCAATQRTVTDAQITNTSNIVTFTASTVTEDDVNAFITDRTDKDYTQAGPTIPAYTKIDRINYGNPLAFPPQSTATSITLSNAATASASNSSFTIYRPTDAFTWDMTNGGAATGYAGTLNGIKNSGVVARLKNMVGGTFDFASLSGDSNMGNLRVSRAANSGNPCAVTVWQGKAENTQAGAVTAMMDPVYLLDRTDMLNFEVAGGSVVPGSGGGRDVVRMDQSQTRSPSIKVNLEALDPFNNTYTNIWHDTSTGKVLPATPMSGNFTSGRKFYPDLRVNKDLILINGMLQQSTAAPTYGATVTPDASNGSWQTITVTNSTAFTIAAPPNPPSSSNTAELVIEVLNSSGGAMGAITWNAAFVFPTGSWTNPASTKKRFARFEWNGVNWICTSLASADY